MLFIKQTQECTKIFFYLMNRKQKSRLYYKCTQKNKTFSLFHPFFHPWLWKQSGTWLLWTFFWKWRYNIQKKSSREVPRWRVIKNIWNWSHGANRKSHRNRLSNLPRGKPGYRWTGPRRHQTHNGKYILYDRENVIGGIYDDRFLITPTDGARALMPNASMETPYEGAKEMILVEELEDYALMSKLLEALSEDLPMPRPRIKRWSDHAVTFWT